MSSPITESIPVPGVERFRNMIESASSALQTDPIADYYASLLNDDYIKLLMALIVSAVLGALIAYHPKRHVESGGPASDKEVRNTMILICIAGAVMVALIQGSLERAFGLVGLGSFVRYRTSLRNPVDLSIIFLLIGLGMSCGLQLYAFAFTIGSFIYILLYILEFDLGGTRHVWALKVDSNEPIRVEKVFREVSKEKNLQIVKIRTSKQGGGFRCRFVARRQIDTEELTKIIQNKCGQGVHYARFEWMQENE